ncbi:MAG: hypothetical protein PHI34_14935 [Acidobacteriota bacterium]|nr:hypothetical protein [Acidobacteriota bacterium]
MKCFGLAISIAALFAGYLPAVQNAPPAADPILSPGAFSRIESDIPEFERLFLFIRSTLDRNKTVFRGRTGLIRGFASGTAYPQIWLRDAATIIPASRVLYPLPYLKSWLIEHLAIQKSDGELQDWLDSRGRADKNTTETDQETSALHAAAQIADLIGPAWLDEPLYGATLLARLERALLYVWNERRDDASGLIKGAHTIDWGDVEMEEPDQRAIYAGPGTHWTADIYDQAQFYRAAQALARMLRRKGNGAAAAPWDARADEIRRLSNRALWQEKRGFYRVHIHLTPLRHGFDEDTLFAMGGNVEAIDAGMTTLRQTGRILAAALARQKQYRISTVSGVLLPPYAKGVFRHPMVDDPYEYQNGGQWDWFGGKLVLALFRNGGPGPAETALLEIARKAIANNGLFEWDDPAGHGRGSPAFSGSAGSLARALIEGYYGLDVSADGLRIEPRLGKRRGAIHLFFPAAGRYAAYRYAFDADAGRIKMSWSSDWPVPALVRIPWPAGLEAALRDRFKVSLDGRATDFRVEPGFAGPVVIVQTEPGPHTLDIEFLKSR